MRVSTTRLWHNSLPRSRSMDEMRKGAALLTGNVVVSADMGHVHAVAGDRRSAEAVITE